jgi:hypothetical protein
MLGEVNSPNQPLIGCPFQLQSSVARLQEIRRRPHWLLRKGDEVLLHVCKEHAGVLIGYSAKGLKFRFCYKASTNMPMILLVALGRREVYCTLIGL